MFSNRLLLKQKPGCFYRTCSEPLRWFSPTLDLRASVLSGLGFAGVKHSRSINNPWEGLAVYAWLVEAVIWQNEL